jgi:hydroxymethylpyrimidine/phosphomethylpyrimidine kinase
MPAAAPPVALTIAGSDCSAGAGAQADLKTFTALGVYGLTALTCVVSETPGRVQRIQAVDPEVVADQIRLLLDSFPVAAIKTGMLYSAEIASVVAQALADAKVPIVIDPVMVATSGDLLLKQEAIAVYERDLFPLAAVITPNMDEAATLLGRKIDGVDAMRTAAEELRSRYRVPVLLKGGHLRGAQAIDLLFQDGEPLEFTAPFVDGVDTHGTGCTYAAAIAARLAAGEALDAAVATAKKFVTAAIAQHFAWPNGAAEIHALNHSAPLTLSGRR